jgi:hypothetical protein
MTKFILALIFFIAMTLSSFAGDWTEDLLRSAAVGPAGDPYGCVAICGNPTCCLASAVGIPTCKINAPVTKLLSKSTNAESIIKQCDKPAVGAKTVIGGFEALKVSDANVVSGAFEAYSKSPLSVTFGVCCWSCGPEGTAACCGYCSQPR